MMDDRALDELWVRHLANEGLDAVDGERVAQALRERPELMGTWRADRETDRMLAGIGAAERTADAFVARTLKALPRSSGGAGGAGGWLLATIAALTVGGGIVAGVQRVRAPQTGEVTTDVAPAPARPTPTLVPAPPPPRWQVPAERSATTTFDVIAALPSDVSAELGAFAPASDGWFSPQPELLRCLGHQHWAGMRVVAGVATGRGRLIDQGLQGYEAAARWLREHEGQPQLAWCMGPLVASWMEVLDAFDRVPPDAALVPRLERVREGIARARTELARPAVRRWLSSGRAHPNALVSIGAAWLAIGERDGDARVGREGRTTIAAALATKGAWDAPAVTSLIMLRHLHAVFHLLDPAARDAVLQAGTAVLTALPPQLPRAIPRSLVLWVRALHERRVAER